MSYTNCSKCHEPVPVNGRHLTCASCSDAFHLGKSCAGVSDRTFKAMSSVKRELWCCHKCRHSSDKSSSGSTEAVSQSEPTSFSSQLMMVNDKLDQLLSLKSSVDTLLKLPAKVEELLTVKVAVEAVERSITEVLDSIAFQSAQYDSLLKKVSDNEATVAKLQTEVGSLKSSLSSQSQEIQLLRAELNNSEQFSRQSNLEIHGFPCSPNENLPSALGDIAQKIGIREFKTSEIDTVHRLPSTRGATPVILVRFRAVQTRERWLSSRRLLGPLAREKVLPVLYFNENLTRANKELFWRARSKGNEKHYKYVWVKNAKIYAKKTESTPVVRINCVSDLELIV